VLRVERDQILAFRLASHHLTARLSAGSLAAAAAACGIQDTPLNTAPLAFHARVAELGPADVGRALTADKSLLGVWSARGAPYVVPTADAAVFTAGALPVDQVSFGVFLGGWAASLEAAGLSVPELLDAMASAAMQALDGRPLLIDELRTQIARRVPALKGVSRPSGAHADLPEPLLRALGLLGLVCIAAEPGSDPRLARTDAKVARTDRWLGRPLRDGDRPPARAELARRFLHCYGPSTPRAFAEWTTRSVADARDAFALLDEELVEIDAAGTKAWALVADADALADPPQADGIRLLPPQRPLPAAARPDHAAARQDAAPTRVAAGPATRGGADRRPAGRYLAVTASGQAPGRDGRAVRAVGNTDPGHDSGRGGPDRTASRLRGGTAHLRHLTIGSYRKIKA
jgi:hypothetical protein